MPIKKFIKSYWWIYLIIIAFIEPLTWFSLGEKLLDSGWMPNVLIVAIPLVLVTVVFLLAYFITPRRLRLVPDKPRDTRQNRRNWSSTVQNGNLTKLLKEKQATMLDTWPGKELQRINLNYDGCNSQYTRYNEVMPQLAKEALERWQLENSNYSDSLRGEPWGSQVRLEKVTFDHSKHDYTIDLSPTKYLSYVSIQARLWNAKLARLRAVVFENAMSFISSRCIPLLPNNFALHMAIVSSDGKLLIRQRSDQTELYPGLWEASIGEFMHGPGIGQHPHFTAGEKPDLALFCINAVAEETNYREATADQFKVYGFGIEYLTLAPKMFVVYQSAASMDTLLSQGQADDPGKRVSSINLSPRVLGDAFVANSSYLWTPSSRIMSLLALTASATSERERDSLLKEFEETYRDRHT